MRLGEVPRKRHLRFEVEGAPVHEELFSRGGYTGPSSLLYHRHLPEAVQDVVEGDADDISMENEKVHEHALLQGFRLPDPRRRRSPAGSGCSSTATSGSAC